MVNETKIFWFKKIRFRKKKKRSILVPNAVRVEKSEEGRLNMVNETKIFWFKKIRKNGQSWYPTQSELFMK